MDRSILTRGKPHNNPCFILTTEREPSLESISTLSRVDLLGDVKIKHDISELAIRFDVENVLC